MTTCPKCAGWFAEAVSYSCPQCGWRTGGCADCGDGLPGPEQVIENTKDDPELKEYLARLEKSLTTAQVVEVKPENTANG